MALGRSISAFFVVTWGKKKNNHKAFVKVKSQKWKYHLLNQVNINVLLQKTIEEKHEANWVLNNTVAITTKGLHNSNGFPAGDVLERMQSSYSGFSYRASSSWKYLNIITYSILRRHDNYIAINARLASWLVASLLAKIRVFIHGNGATMGEYPKITPNILISFSASTLKKGVAGPLRSLSLKNLTLSPTLSSLWRTNASQPFERTGFGCPFLRVEHWKVQTKPLSSIAGKSRTWLPLRDGRGLKNLVGIESLLWISVLVSNFENSAISTLFLRGFLRYGQLFYIEWG